MTVKPVTAAPLTMFWYKVVLTAVPENVARFVAIKSVAAPRSAFCVSAVVSWVEDFVANSTVLVLPPLVNTTRYVEE